MEEKRYTVYAHVNVINGKIYVGQTCRKVKRRWGNETGYAYKRNKKFYEDIQKFGWDNFEHLILAENLSYDECNYWENRLTIVWDTIENGYNYHEGGMKDFHGNKHTEEHKKELSLKWIGDNNPMRINPRYGEKNSFYGRHHSEETKQKLRLTRIGVASKKKGTTVPEEIKMKQSRPVLQMTEDGTVIQEFYGVAKAAEITGINKAHIYACCRGQRRRAKGYKWAFKYPKEDEVEIFVNKKKRVVNQYEKDGTFVSTYSSVIEAANAVGVTYSAIVNCCRGKTKSSGGYRFEYG